MKCLITGAAGFIGSALTERLIREGHEVIGLIHRTKPRFIDENVEYFQVDITDKKSIKPAFKDIDVVFHCAAKVKDYGPKKLFYKINLEGTKNLAEVSEEYGVKKFIFLSHLRYESEEYKGHYSKTKALAERYLNEKYKKDGFPVVIIRPGNVYGPGATIAVLRVLDTIKRNRIALIDGGSGIFLHTYIDNLLDALIAAMIEPKAVGETIDITDGDNSTTWGEYLNSLARIAGKPSIKKKLSKNTALLLSKIMMLLYTIFKIEPLVTPMAVHVFTNNRKISIEKAKRILNYEPHINFEEGMRRVKNWLKANAYIN